MADIGKTTVMGNRTSQASPRQAAFGPTPGTPSTSVGQFAREQVTRAVAPDAKVVNLSDRGHGMTRWTYYTMIGMDAATTQRDTWRVIAAQDLTGAQYTGQLAKPLRNISVLAVKTT
jgi:hypothetical protein